MAQVAGEGFAENSDEHNPTAMDENQGVARQLEDARKRLLDLTMRNRLLNYRPSKVRAVHVLEPNLPQAFHVLVAEEKSFRFKPSPEPNQVEEPQRVPTIVDQDDQHSGDTPRNTRNTRVSTLQADLVKTDLDSRLVNASRQSRVFVEEQGYNALHLAFGFLEWSEREETGGRRAPLVLVPVEITRTQVRSQFSVRWTGEDITPNLSLSARLADQGVKLPEFEEITDAKDLSSYLAQVSEAISDRTKWRVLFDLYMDFFSYTNLVMYRDLDPDSWPEDASPIEHPLLKAILDPEPGEPTDSGLAEHEIDRKIRPQDTWHVTDADPSQIIVIEDVGRGKNLVVEGPPGTGKSQTIVNCIARLLADGKSVLFVSEKMAALDVVRRRLDNVGLGDYCLELHSRTARKRAIVDEIGRTLSLSTPAGADADGRFLELETLQTHLDGYADELRRPFGELRMTPTELIGTREQAQKHFDEMGLSPPPVNFASPELWNQEELRRSSQALEDLVDIADRVAPIHLNAWSDCDPPRIMLPQDIEDVRVLLSETSERIDELDSSLALLPDMLARPEPDWGDEFKIWVGKLSSWFLRRGDRVNVRREIDRLDVDSMDEELRSSLSHVSKESERAFAVLHRTHRHQRRVVQDWLGEVLPIADRIPGIRAELTGLLNLGGSTLQLLEDEWITFTTLKNRLASWEVSMESLPGWSEYSVSKRACLGTGAGPIVNLIESGALEARDALPCFRIRFTDQLLRKVYEERPDLAEFIRERHENRIASFQRLDADLIGLNRQRLASTVHQRCPALPAGASRESEAGILSGEINRKRGHMPIRKLMKLAGNFVQRVKPCFLMSPLSVAQFLDPIATKFDVVIFDEASQVRPEGALGALLRAEQAVVIGDTQQLPPTRFFDSIAGDALEPQDDLTSIADVESILHQCRRSFPVKVLRWHYRSRHESLIAVSNQEFYSNSLLVYPSTWGRKESLGLEFKHLSHTIYDRGRSRVNREEARAVAQDVVEHFTKSPDKTLGVGTFSVPQQEAILDEIEVLLLDSEDVEQCFDPAGPEPFFVKNLETIQGDERDVIFISLGYGKDSDGRLTMNFGPLNQEGGHRRLNVLISRAREKCTVYSNFRASDLSIEGDAPTGLRALKTFLEYAQTGNLVSSETVSDDVESPFEQAVMDFLQSCGHQVRPQIGCAGFRVDLGVVDPRAPGRYAIGVECDGAMYHSSHVARERDRLRQQILEDRGWVLHRVWSTDWYRDRPNAQARLVDAVESALRDDAPTIDREREGSKDDVVGIVRDESVEESSEVPGGLVDGIQEYIPCSFVSLRPPPNAELHRFVRSDLPTIIEEIVDAESPIHFEEMIRRAQKLIGRGRAGSRIQRAYRAAVRVGCDSDMFELRGIFLWKSVMLTPTLRRRTGSPSPKIELICREEIIEAIKHVIGYQSATPMERLAVDSLRCLGFGRAAEGTKNVVRKTIESMMVSDELRELESGLIDLSETA